MKIFGPVRMWRKRLHFIGVNVKRKEFEINAHDICNFLFLALNDVSFHHKQAQRCPVIGTFVPDVVLKALQHLRIFLYVSQRLFHFAFSNAYFCSKMKVKVKD
jgi:hypothetical protein